MSLIPCSVKHYSSNGMEVYRPQLSARVRMPARKVKVKKVRIKSRQSGVQSVKTQTVRQASIRKGAEKRRKIQTRKEFRSRCHNKLRKLLR